MLEPDLPRVTIFGSCRVHFPLKLLNEKGAISLFQAHIFGFTHSPAEMLQQIRIMDGEQVVPTELQPYVNLRPEWNARMVKRRRPFEELFRATDIFVVEISSIRKITYEGLVLQINRVRNNLVDEVPANTPWWQKLVREGKNQPDLLGDAFDGVRRDLASGLTAHEQTPEELAADIAELSSILARPILFVSHFNTDKAGNAVPQRQRIVDVLEAQVVPNSSFFNPTPLVHQNGVARSISDMSHYRPEFIPLIAEAMASKVDEMRPLFAA